MDEFDYGNFSIVTKVGADTTEAVSAFTSLTTILTTFGGVVGLVSGAVGSFAAGALVHAISKAGEFQTQMVKITTLTNETVGDMNDLSDAVLEMAARLGVGVDELANGLYTITSAGIVGADALNLLEQSAKASLIGMGDVNEIARVAAAAMQAWKSENLSATDAIEIMLEGVRQGSIEADEYGNSLARVIGIASQMGVSFEEVNSFVATFSRLGAGADVATTALRAALTAILSPGEKARKVFDEIGISIDEMRDKIRTEGLTLAFIDMMEASQGNLDVIGQLMPNVRALSGVLGTAGVAAKTYTEITEKMNTRSRDMSETFEIYNETFVAQLRQLKAELDVFFVTIGNFGLPIATTALEWFNAAIDGTKSFVRELRILKNMIEGDIDWQAGIDALRGGEGLQRALLSNPDVTMRVKARGELENLDYSALQAYKKTLEEIADRKLALATVLGADPKNNESLRETLMLLEETNLAIKNIEDNRPKVDGIVGLVGPTNEQREAVQKIIDKLHEQYETLKGNERALLEESLAAENATNADKNAALALFDKIVALKEAQDAEEKLTKLMEQRFKAAERMTAQMREEGRRIEEQANNREYDERMRQIQVTTDVEIAAIEAHVERLNDFMKETSQSIVDNLFNIVDGTKGVGPAFGDMVTEILMHIARLKLEEAIIGPLLNAFSPLPSTPGPIDLPAGLTDSITKNSQSLIPTGSSVVVQQSITYAPSLIDARSGAEFIAEHGRKIAEISIDAISNSSAIARQVGR